MEPFAINISMHYFPPFHKATICLHKNRKLLQIVHIPNQRKNENTSKHISVFVQCNITLNFSILLIFLVKLTERDCNFKFIFPVPQPYIIYNLQLVFPLSIYIINHIYILLYTYLSNAKLKLKRSVVYFHLSEYLIVNNIQVILICLGCQ